VAGSRQAFLYTILLNNSGTLLEQFRFDVSDQVFQFFLLSRTRHERDGREQAVRDCPAVRHQGHHGQGAPRPPRRDAQRCGQAQLRTVLPHSHSGQGIPAFCLIYAL
jgi:hypothetical protein